MDPDAKVVDGRNGSNIIIRLHKEHILYKKEAEEQQRKLDKFIANSAEDWDINNGVRFNCPGFPQLWLTICKEENDAGGRKDDHRLC